MLDIFTPAKTLMSKLTFSKKFLLINAIVVISTLLLAGPVLMTETMTMQEAEMRKVGIDNFGIAVNLLEEIGEHRAESLKANIGLAGGDEKAKLLATQIDGAMKELIVVAESYPELALTATWKELHEQWQWLKLTKFQEEGVVEWFEERGHMGLYDAHTVLIEKLRSSLKAFGYGTGIAATENRVQVMAVELSGYTIPRLLDGISQTVSALTLMVKDGTFTPNAFLRLSEQANSVEIVSKKVGELLGLLNSVAQERVGSAQLEHLTAYIGKLRNNIMENDEFNVELGNTYIQETEQHIEAFKSMQNQLIQLAADEVAADLSSSKNLIIRYIVVSTLLILLNSYLLVGFSRGVNSTVNQLKGSAEALASGDLSRRLEISTEDEMAQIIRSFNKISEAFDSVVSDVKHSMVEVERSVSSVSSVSAQTMSGMEDHAKEIDVMVAAMTEMAATAQDVEKNTVEAAGATREADNHTKEGEAVVQSAISTIQKLAEEVVRTSGVMQQLAEDANGIGAVTDVIRGIADQTNLLALNAAIEAARAGEQGRGFAVVADEVRTLAQRTRESTDEIQNMINTLQVASSDALDVINASRAKVDESVEQICKTGSALESINDSVERVNSMNEQIASAATEQASTADEITNNMGRVRNIAEQASDGANSLVAAATQLEQSARNTSRSLSRFKVSG